MTPTHLPTWAYLVAYALISFVFTWFVGAFLHMTSNPPQPNDRTVPRQGDHYGKDESRRPQSNPTR